MTYRPVKADPDEQKLWDEFARNGVSVTTDDGDVIVGLAFWREEDNPNFIAGYLLDNGDTCEGYNIPDPVLESICPGRNIWWNSAEHSHTAMGTNSLFDSNATEADLAAIEAIFLAYGFRNDA